MIKFDQENLYEAPIRSKFLCINLEEALHNENTIRCCSILVKVRQDYWELMDENDDNVLEKIHCSKDVGIYNDQYAYYCQPMNSNIEDANKSLKDVIEANKANDIELDFSPRQNYFVIEPLLTLRNRENRFIKC